MPDAKKSARCKPDCIYAGKITETMICCNYLLHTGLMRPYPPGKGCTVYTRGERKRKDPNHWED